MGSVKVCGAPVKLSVVAQSEEPVEKLLRGEEAEQLGKLF